MEMPPGVFSGEAARRFTGGPTEFEVEASNLRRLILEFDRCVSRFGIKSTEG